MSQKREALNRANQIRVLRAELKRALHQDSRLIFDVIAEPEVPA